MNTKNPFLNQANNTLENYSGILGAAETAERVRPLASLAMAFEFNRFNNLLEEEVKNGGVLDALNGLRDLQYLQR